MCKSKIKKIMNIKRIYQIWTKFMKIYLGKCRSLISWENPGQDFSLLHDRQDLGNDLEGQGTWDLGLELRIGLLILIPPISDAFKSRSEQMDGFEKEVGWVPPGVHICDHLPELTINGIWVILKQVTFSPDSLMVWRWVMDSCWEVLALLKIAKIMKLLR